MAAQNGASGEMSFKRTDSLDVFAAPQPDDKDDTVPRCAALAAYRGLNSETICYSVQIRR